MRIAFYSSKRERCGISTYTDHLAGALTQLGHQVKYFSSAPPYDQTIEEIVAWHPEIFHVQHEAAIMPPNNFLKAYCDTIRSAGAQVFCTIHGEVENNVYAAQGCVKDNRHIIMHRPPTLIGGVTVIPAAEIFNVANANTVLQRYQRTGDFRVSRGTFTQNQFFNQIIEVQSPRILRLGLNVNF